MASIDIFPISIGGVQPPLNLLAGLLTPNPTDSKYLNYPIDLASNPTYCHAIQFTAFDYQVDNLAAVAAEISKTTANITSQALQAASNAKALNKKMPNTVTSVAEAGKVTGVVYQIGSNVGKIFQENGPELANEFKTLAQKKTYDITVNENAPQSVISLYMPDSITTEYDSNYTAISMTDTLGLAGYLANALGDEKLENVLNKDIATNLKNPAVNQLMAYLAGKGVAGLGGNAENFTGVLQRAFRQYPNPQMQMIYKGINLREFQFEFIFTPVSNKEAVMVDTIIKRFVYHSVPQLTPNTNGQYLIPPQIFKIKFAYTGNPGIMGAVSNVFKNTLTNVIGSQLSNVLTGGNPSDTITNGVGKAKLFEIGNCVLSNVSVDYSPNGWAAYNDGHPVQTRMVLHFKEMDIFTKDKIIPTTQMAPNLGGDIPNPSGMVNNSISSLGNASSYGTGGSSESLYKNAFGVQ